MTRPGACLRRVRENRDQIKVACGSARRDEGTFFFIRRTAETRTRDSFLRPRHAFLDVSLQAMPFNEARRRLAHEGDALCAANVRFAKPDFLPTERQDGHGNDSQ